MRSCFQRIRSTSWQQHLDLAADQQTLEGGVFDVDIGDVDLLELGCLFLDSRQRPVHVGKLSPYREREGHHGAFHALERVDAQELHQALFAVRLTEEPFARARSRVLYFSS